MKRSFNIGTSKDDHPSAIDDGKHPKLYTHVPRREKEKGEERRKYLGKSNRQDIGLFPIALEWRAIHSGRTWAWKPESDVHIHQLCPCKQTLIMS